MWVSFLTAPCERSTCNRLSRNLDSVREKIVSQERSRVFAAFSYGVGLLTGGLWANNLRSLKQREVTLQGEYSQELANLRRVAVSRAEMIAGMIGTVLVDMAYRKMTAEKEPFHPLLKDWKDLFKWPLISVWTGPLVLGLLFSEWRVARAQKDELFSLMSPQRGAGGEFSPLPKLGSVARGKEHLAKFYEDSASREPSPAGEVGGDSERVSSKARVEELMRTYREASPQEGGGADGAAAASPVESLLTFCRGLYQQLFSEYIAPKAEADALLKDLEAIEQDDQVSNMAKILVADDIQALRKLRGEIDQELEVIGRECNKEEGNNVSAIAIGIAYLTSMMNLLITKVDHLKQRVWQDLE